MEDYVAQSRRDQEVLTDFLAANPTQHSCAILRSNTMSYKPEVFVDNQWSDNGVAFATKEEAERSAYDLMNRWLLVTDYRAVGSEQTPNYEIVDGKMYPIEADRVRQKTYSAAKED